VATEHIEAAWKALRRNPIPVMLGELLVVAIVLFIMFLCMMPLIAVMAAVDFPQDPQQAVPVLLAHKVALAAAAGGFIIAVFLGSALSGGLVGMFAKALRGKTRLGIILDVARKHWLSFIGVQLIELVLVCLAFLVFFLPFLLFGTFWIVVGLILATIAMMVMAVLLVYAPMAVAVNGLNAMDAVRRSIQVGRANFWSTLAMLAIFVVLNMVTGFVPIIGGLIGILVLAPLQVLSFTSLYLKRGQTRRK
jgi:MFS family permease